MKKLNRKLLAACIAGGVLWGGANVSLAAENPLASVPQDHWAYSAVEKLVNDGLVDGYTDGEFKGDRPISRYEMAILVAKAMSNVEKADAEDQAAIGELQKEFGNELKNLGVRMDNLESRMSSFKWFGDARMRYFRNKEGKITNDMTYGNSSQLEHRLRLGFYGDIDKNLSVKGRLKTEDANQHKHDGWSNDLGKGSSHDGTYADLLGLSWQAPHDTKIDIGRIEVSLGQGGLWWENPMDGVSVTKKLGKTDVTLGYGDLTAENWHENEEPAFFANVSVPVSDKTTITAAMLKTNGGGGNMIGTNRDNHNDGTWKTPFTLEQYALGVNTQLNDKLNLFVEGIQNKADEIPDDADDKGVWARLTYGDMQWNKAKTWQVYGEYFNLGNYAVDSSGWGHRMNIAGGNGYGNDGAKGWGLGAGYMVAANTNLELTYYKLKPYDEEKAGFSKYKDMGYMALTYSF